MPICLHCMQFVNYNEIVKPVTINIRGIDVTYKETTAYCSDCGAEVYSDKIHDKNVARREQAYLNALKGV